MGFNPPSYSWIWSLSQTQLTVISQLKCLAIQNHCDPTPPPPAVCLINQPRSLIVLTKPINLKSWGGLEALPRFLDFHSSGPGWCVQNTDVVEGRSFNCCCQHVEISLLFIIMTNDFYQWSLEVLSVYFPVLFMFLLLFSPTEQNR